MRESKGVPKPKHRGTTPSADERLRRSKDDVRSSTLAATYELLTEVGLSGLSVDEVSRRSGVAKTTIYRHWPERSTLLLEACMQFSPRMQTPNTGSLKGDLEALALTMAD